MFSVDLDDDNRIRSTYKANIYDMPFGMFVGLNNHFLSVIYVGVLLTKETAESFSWAFREFVSMMGGKPPVTMLTGYCFTCIAYFQDVSAMLFFSR